MKNLNLLLKHVGVAWIVLQDFPRVRAEGDYSKLSFTCICNGVVEQAFASAFSTQEGLHLCVVDDQNLLKPTKFHVCLSVTCVLNSEFSSVFFRVELCNYMGNLTHLYSGKVPFLFQYPCGAQSSAWRNFPFEFPLQIVVSKRVHPLVDSHRLQLQTRLYNELFCVCA